MLFDIDQDSKSLSIFEQIVRQVIFGIASGAVEVGDLIPSVRTLGVQLRVHPNTVAKAFQELERMGVVAERRGRGMEVTPEAPELCRRYRQDKVRERIREALREAATSGLSPDELRALVEEELYRVNGKRRV
jgi:DNA-binding transcriptional regulator YhcF (GntR family)